MRFLVTADVHLTADRPERLAALEAIVNLANDEGVDYLLIAGDLFDENVDVEDVKTGIRDLFSGNEFEALVIPGNHDASAFRDEDYFGDDIEVLSAQPFEHRDLGSVNLVGVPFTDGEFGDLVDDLREVRSDEKLNVLLIHGTLSTSVGGAFGGESRYLPFTAEQLVETGFEYVFAGHIHSSASSRSFGDDTCVFAYPGSPVSITRNETDRRAVWLFDTENGALQERRIDSFHYVRETMDLVPGEADAELAALEDRLTHRDLEQVTLLIEPTGFIEMDGPAFFERLDQIVSGAGGSGSEIERSGVVSARTIVESPLYEKIDEKLDARDDIDSRAVRRMVLRAMSAVGR